MADFVALAVRLIAKHGRTVTIKKVNRAVSDNTKPWRGHDTLYDATTISTKAAFVDPKDIAGYYQDKQDAVPRCEKVALIAADIELDGYDVVADGSTSWMISKLHTIQPGTTKYLFILELKQ